MDLNLQFAWPRRPILWEHVGYIFIIIFVHAKYEPDRGYKQNNMYFDILGKCDFVEDASKTMPARPGTPLERCV